MKNLTASEWKATLLWGLAWQCMSMVQFAITQDLSLGNGFAKMECERLPATHCAFAVGAGGFRCVLETAIHVDGSIAYECQTLRLEMQPGSDANRYALQLGSDGNPFFANGYIETDECVKACGLQRLTVGVSTDDIFNDSNSLANLCSPTCRQSCGNIIDHYGVLMAEAGEDLTRMCQGLMEYLRSNRRDRAKSYVSSTVVQKSNQELAEHFRSLAPSPSSDWLH